MNDALLSEEQLYWLELLRAHIRSCDGDDKCATFRHLLFRGWEAGVPEPVLIIAGRLDRPRLRKLIIEDVREDALFAEEMART